MTAERRLVLVRHASAEPAGGAISDESRALTAAGEDEAKRLAVFLKERGVLGDAVLCSPALRTRQTWATVDEATGHGVLIAMEPSIYEADTEVLLRAIRENAEDVATLVVVGHAPGIPMLAYDLCGGQGADEHLETLTRHFVPASCAVLRVEGGWSELARGVAELEVVRAGDA